MVFVLGTGSFFRVVVIEDEASVFRQNVPVAFGFQLVNDVVRRWCNNQRRFEGDRAVLFQVTQHGSDDLHVAFVNHTGTNEAQIHFTAIVVRSRTDYVVGVTLGYVFVVYVRVGNHRLVDGVQVYHHFGVVLGVVVRSQSWLFTRLDTSNTLVSQSDQAFQHAGFVVHAFVDHDLDAGLSQFQRLDQGFIGRNTDRSFRFHFCSPVGEGEGLVSQQGADLYFDHTTLEYVFAVELLQHLRLGSVYDVAEVHVRLHFAFEGYLHRLRNRHGRFTSGQCDSNGTGVSTERHTFGHTGVRVTTDDDRAVVHSNVVQYFVDYVGHGVVNAFRVTGSDYTECVHERHQLRRVGLGFFVPYRRSVTARLERTIHAWGDGSSGHGFQFLTGHRTSGVLRTYDVHFNANVRTGVQRGLGFNADGVAVEDLLNSGQTLAWVRDFFGSGVNNRSFDAQSLSSEGLQFLTEGYGVRTTGFHEFDFLRGERRGYVNQHIALAVQQLLGFGVDGQNGAGLNRVFFFQYRVAVGVTDDVAVFVFFLYPVFQVQTDTAGYTNSSQEDRGDTVGTSHHRTVVNKRDVRRGFFTGPQCHVVHTRHTGRTHAHGAFLSDQHYFGVWVVFTHFFDFLLSLRRNHAQAVQFTVSTGVRLVARRQQVGRDITFSSDVGDNFNFFRNVGQLGEEFGFGVAFQNVFSNGVAGFVSSGQTAGVGVVQENLRLQNFAGSGVVGIVRQRDVQQHFNRRAAFHVRQQL